MHQSEISNWGRYPVARAEVVPVLDVQAIGHAWFAGGNLARGMGRSYGDTAIAGRVYDMLPSRHLLDFDPSTGVLHAEAGVTFDKILEVFVPKGWFLPVTPGTRFVTLGGAIASDVHGKNHHSEGSLSRHVISFRLLTEDGTIHTITPTQSDWFQSTLGGMGLTGIILDAHIRLKAIDSAWIQQHTYKACDLRHIFDLFEQTQAHTYSVAWIDCLASGSKLGRSLLMTGEHAPAEAVPTTAARYQVHSYPKLSIPFDFPEFVLNTYSIKAFNTLFYHKNLKNNDHSMVHYAPFFYPLDAIMHWNRMYGKGGFTQYQFVIPKADGYRIMKLVLETIATSGQGSFLAVLKLFGKQEDLISFPMEGYTLALDFAIKPSLFPLLHTLDSMVKEAGGRIYLTKDVRMSGALFKETYPNAQRFIDICKSINPGCTFRSAQSDRLGITPW